MFFRDAYPGSMYQVYEEGIANDMDKNHLNFWSHVGQPSFIYLRRLEIILLQVHTFVSKLWANNAYHDNIDICDLP